MALEKSPGRETCHFHFQLKISDLICFRSSWRLPIDELKLVPLKEVLKAFWLLSVVHTMAESRARPGFVAFNLKGDRQEREFHLLKKGGQAPGRPPARRGPRFSAGLFATAGRL